MTAGNREYGGCGRDIDVVAQRTAQGDPGGRAGGRAGTGAGTRTGSRAASLGRLLCFRLVSVCHVLRLLRRALGHLTPLGLNPAGVLRPQQLCAQRQQRRPRLRRPRLQDKARQAARPRSGARSKRAKPDGATTPPRAQNCTLDIEKRLKKRARAPRLSGADALNGQQEPTAGRRGPRRGQAARLCTGKLLCCRRRRRRRRHACVAAAAHRAALRRVTARSLGRSHRAHRCPGMRGWGGHRAVGCRGGREDRRA